MIAMLSQYGRETCGMVGCLWQKISPEGCFFPKMGDKLSSVDWSLFKAFLVSVAATVRILVVMAYCLVHFETKLVISFLFHCH